MSSVNKILILGRLTKEPELKYTPGGNSVCNFTVATSEKWKDKSGELQEKTEFHNIVIWGKQAENCNLYLSKGKQVYLEGKLATRSWDDKNGIKKYTTEIIASVVQFLSPKSDQSNQDNKPSDNKKDYKVDLNESFAQDSIPF